jgi:processing peptidase subunit alpha
MKSANDTFDCISADENQTESTPDVNTGVTQLLELTSFKGTKSLSSQDVSKRVEKLGGMVQCISSREHIIFCIDTLRVNASDAIELIADSVISPRVLPEDVEEAKHVIAMQNQFLAPVVASRDALNIAGYKNSPMGNFHLCPEHRVQHLSLDMLEKFRKDKIFASNVIVAGTGIAHKVFVDIVSDKFASISNRKQVYRRPKSVYTGGMRVVQRELPEPVVKVAIGYEYASGWNDKDLIAGIVLQSLLGGGASFSAGGPGKGMYTRLYRDVLNKYHWVESAEALINIFDDSAMLAIDLACPEDSVPGAIQVIANEYWKLCDSLVTDVEIDRAKNMAKSSMLMQLESRLVTCEDIARQMAVFGERKDIMETCALIDAVQAQDLMSITKKMMTTVPTIAITGAKVDNIPEFDVIQKFLKSKAV